MAGCRVTIKEPLQKSLIITAGLVVGTSMYRLEPLADAGRSKSGKLTRFRQNLRRADNVNQDDQFCWVTTC